MEQKKSLTSLKPLILRHRIIPSSYHLPPLLFRPPPPSPPPPVHLLVLHPDTVPRVSSQPPPLTLPEIPLNSETFIYEHRLVSRRVPTLLLRSILLNPSLPPPACQNICRVDPHGCIAPAHIPDLSDLPLLPPALICFLRWYLRQPATTNNQLLPPSLELLVDPVPSLPRLRETYLLNLTSKDLRVLSFTNTVKLFKTASRLRELDVRISWESMGSQRELFMSLTGSDRKQFSARLGRIIDVVADGDSPRAALEFFDSFLVPANMNILYWNCRGIARPSFATHLCYLINTHKPDIVILSETRVTSPNSLTILRRLPFDSYEVLDPVGFSGGIIILWNMRDAAVTLVNKGAQLINVVVQGTITGLSTFEARF